MLIVVMDFVNNVQTFFMKETVFVLSSSLIFVVSSSRECSGEKNPGGVGKVVG